jgi:hypothetical protein
LRRTQHARFGIGFLCVMCGLRQDDLFAIESVALQYRPNG